MIENILKLILRLSGALLVLAFIAVFLPYEIMNVLHNQMGLGKLPQIPIVDYLARSVSLFYGIHGVFVIYISFNIRHYVKFLKLLCILGFIFGVTIFFIDLFLFKNIDSKKHTIEKIMTHTELVVRKSCAPPNTMD